MRTTSMGLTSNGRVAIARTVSARAPSPATDFPGPALAPVEVFLELGHLRLRGRAVLTGRAQGAAVVEELLVVPDQVLLEENGTSVIGTV